MTVDDLLAITSDNLSPGHLFEPIPVEQFKEHVKSLHRNDDYPFSEEYSVSPSQSNQTCCLISLYWDMYRMLNRVMPPPLKHRESVSCIIFDVFCKKKSPRVSLTP